MKPVKFDDLAFVLGQDIPKLLPSLKNIPEKFKNGQNKWNKVAHDWLFNGVKNFGWKPKEGIDVVDAIKHIKAVMGSWEIPIEHKEIGCAYLLSEFFDDVKYEKI